MGWTLSLENSSNLCNRLKTDPLLYPGMPVILVLSPVVAWILIQMVTQGQAHIFSSSSTEEIKNNETE